MVLHVKSLMLLGVGYIFDNTSLLILIYYLIVLDMATGEDEAVSLKCQKAMYNSKCIQYPQR